VLQGTVNIDFVNFVKSLFFVPYRRPDGEVAPILFVGWTLNYEMAFYATFALGLLIKKPFVRILLLTSLLVALAVMGRVIPGGDIWHFYTNDLILEFATGMWIAFLAPWLLSYFSGTPKVLFFSIIIIMLLELVFNPSLVPPAWGRLSAGLAATLIVSSVVILEGLGTRLKLAPVIIFGNASYAVYITHPFVIQAIHALVARFLLMNSYVTLLILPVVFASVILTGVVIHLWLEIPLSRVSRQLLRVDRLGPDRRDLA